MADGTGQLCERARPGAKPGMVTDSGSAVTPSDSRPGFCRCARCCRRRNWSSGPRTARPTGDFRDVIHAFNLSPPQPPQPRHCRQLHPDPHTHRHPTHHPQYAMVGKVSERVLAREGKQYRPAKGSNAPWLTPHRPRANRQWNEAEQLAGCSSDQSKKLLHVSFAP